MRKRRVKLVERKQVYGTRYLADLPAGAHCVVRQLRGGTEFVSRLAALGFTIGAEVRVVQNYGHGPLIALVRDTRIALGRGEALKVLVEAVNGGQ